MGVMEIGKRPIKTNESQIQVAVKALNALKGFICCVF